MSSDRPARTEFAKLLRRLRGKDPQVEFARKLGILSRSTYSMIERGHRRAQVPHRDNLIKLHPNERAEIEARFAAMDEEDSIRANSSSGRRQTSIQRIILESMKVGRDKEARASIMRELRTSEDPRTRIWLLEHLGCVELALGNADSFMAVASETIETAHASGLHDEERRLRKRLARRLAREGDYTGAHAVIDEGLEHHPDAAALWHRKGILHWYAHEYADAVACFMSARASGLNKRRFLYARGSVFAEWGHFAQAIEDLTFAVENPSTPANQAYARSTRAYALANSGQIDKAFAEWELAELVTPENAWLHYFRALCYRDTGDTDRMLSELRCAIECDVPALNEAKRVHAAEILRQYESSTQTS